MMMRVMTSTPSPAVATPVWAHTYLLGIFYYFLELFLEAHDFLKEAQKVKDLNCYIIYCAMGTPKGVSQTLLGPTVCFHLFLVEWVTFIWVV